MPYVVVAFFPDLYVFAIAGHTYMFHEKTLCTSNIYFCFMYRFQSMCLFTFVAR